ncbi:anti-sigma regulatory factor (Ser/Thr protein kinase) [Streptomyces phaeochromogenes]|uniref:hypothetical protein n=1 Tax=Streptomyces phaeochromogenes TaxID=1923 RepID=UPI00278EC638|nr:hypothetical protein [Streptomyces phaeochromogenes]MDQ0956056.1 anti-sigma regulatory factor (Ser/Thr protein kinase) [Streptomyces phaeochromogenes]
MAFALPTHSRSGRKPGYAAQGVLVVPPHLAEQHDFCVEEGHHVPLGLAAESDGPQRRDHRVGHQGARSQHLGAVVLLPVQAGQLGEGTGQYSAVAFGKWLELAHAGDQRSSLHPVGASAPVDRSWGRSYTLTRASLRRVRDDARMFLTVLGWPGDIAVAAEVLSRLAENAVVHARAAGGAHAEMAVRLSVAEDEMLLVDVEDPFPEFPDSRAAIAGERLRGLMYVQFLGARVTWSLSRDARTKTVRAWLLPDQVSP